MVCLAEILVVQDRVLAAESGFVVGQESAEDVLLLLLAGCERTVREPPDQHETNNERDQTPDQEHPLEADESTVSVHFLEASAHQADDGGGHL